jgi:thymidylate synthase
MIQDIYRGEPWKLVVCTILLNQTSGVQVKRMMRKLFKKFPTEESMIFSTESELSSSISELGLQNVKAKRIRDFLKSIVADSEFYMKDVSELPGVGSYTEESIDVFVRRNIDRDISDKEIRAYVEKIVEFETMKSKVEGDIYCTGSKMPIERYAPTEILNYSYEYDSTLFCDVTDDRLRYVTDKLRDYREALEIVNYRLRWNRYNRQAVIQFDQPEILPNCTVSIQFQIRDNILYLSVFQRSQDVAKMEMDCEIFNRMALEVIKNQEDVDDYKVSVFVGNMHKFDKR